MSQQPPDDKKDQPKAAGKAKIMQPEDDEILDLVYDPQVLDMYKMVGGLPKKGTQNPGTSHATDPMTSDSKNEDTTDGNMSSGENSGETTTSQQQVDNHLLKFEDMIVGFAKEDEGNAASLSEESRERKREQERERFKKGLEEFGKEHR